MSKNIKQLAMIYTAAVVSGVFALTYISHGIDALSVRPAEPATRSVVTANVQGGSPYESYILQPAINVEQPRTTNPQITVGGNGEDDELQPALGYGALNNTVIQ